MRRWLPPLVIAMHAATAAAAPDDLIARRLALDPGELDARLVIEAGLQAAHWLRPLTFAPDLWLGITRRLTIGAIHSDPSLDRIAVGPSFCVRQTEGPCDRIDRSGGLDVRYELVDGPLAVAPRARVLLRDLDPAKPALALGALVRWAHGRVAISSDPYLRIGLANQSRGNRTALSVPLYAALQPARGWALWFHTGYQSDLAVWRDGWHLPVGFGTDTRLGAHLELGVEVGWQSLLGPQHDYRRLVLLFTAGFRS